MNNIPLWANIVIALIGSGLFGGIVSIILSPIAARQQIKQLETTYHQKLNDNLLQNASKYVEVLYVPIYKSLGNLENKYDDVQHFQKSLLTFYDKMSREAIQSEQSTELLEFEEFAVLMRKKAIDAFMHALSEHYKLMEKIQEEGSGVNLTIEFDEQLHRFNRFLYTSCKFSKSLLVMSVEEMEAERKGLLSETSFASPLFEKRFYNDMFLLKSHIKQISLGTSKHSAKR